MSILETQRQIEQTEEFLRRLRDRLEQEMAHQREQPREPPDPEQELKFYRWPASRITRADMIRLTELRTLLRRPITKLLHEAVAEYHRVLTEQQEDTPRCCDRPRLRWKSESASNCYIECSSCGFVLCDDGQLADWHDPEQIAWEQEARAEEGIADPYTAAPAEAHQSVPNPHHIG
jgi:hypothetical protein